jgi:hypothetical protein
MFCNSSSSHALQCTKPELLSESHFSGRMTRNNRKKTRNFSNAIPENRGRFCPHKPLIVNKFLGDFQENTDRDANKRTIISLPRQTQKAPILVSAEKISHPMI